MVSLRRKLGRVLETSVLRWFGGSDLGIKLWATEETTYNLALCLVSPQIVPSNNDRENKKRGNPMLVSTSIMCSYPQLLLSLDGVT